MLDLEFQSLSPHKDLYDLFFAAALKVLELIDSEILDRFKKYNDTNIYADWFLPISKWYYSQNIVIYTRAFKAFCYENARKLKDQGSISCIDDDAIEDFVFREIVGKEKETEEDKQKMEISDSFVTGFAIFVIVFGLIMLKICWI